MLLLIRSQEYTYRAIGALLAPVWDILGIDPLKLRIDYQYLVMDSAFLLYLHIPLVFRHYCSKMYFVKYGGIKLCYHGELLNGIEYCTHYTVPKRHACCT